MTIFELLIFVFFVGGGALAAHNIGQLVTSGNMMAEPNCGDRDHPSRANRSWRSSWANGPVREGVTP
jgi:hypothetical protein